MKDFARRSWWLYAAASIACGYVTYVTGHELHHIYTGWVLLLHLEQATFFIIFGVIAVKNFLRRNREDS
jgi:hypothetical protein